MIGRARISVQRPVGVAWHSRDVDAARELAERRFPWGRNAIIAGTPDELVENLLADAADGVEMIIMPFADRAAPETLRRFGTEIIPAVHQAARTV
jgi:alkanesulfonate monooxygenase SsuD/methylene tetrahydromethanopterin reductase-like flavin-dependent oxidoreductase (luciferase family)